MEGVPKRNNQIAAVVVIGIIAVLLVVLVVLAVFLIDVSVVEPTAAGTEYLPYEYEYQEDEAQPEEIDLPVEEEPRPRMEDVHLTIEAFVSDVTARGDGIYYIYSRWDTLLVTRISADGLEERNTEIEWEERNWPFIIAFEVTAEGDFLFILRDFGDFLDPDREENYYFLRYRAGDSTITYQNISDELSLNMDTAFIDTVAFDAEENVFIILRNADVAYILDPNGRYRSYIELDDLWVANAFQARDGHVILLGRDSVGDLVLKGVDLETNTLVIHTTFCLSLLWLWEAYSGQNSTEFDILIDFMDFDDDSYGLYGFNIETGELSLLFDWEDFDVLPNWDNDILFLQDGRIAVFQRYNTRARFWTELRIFTP